MTPSRTLEGVRGATPRTSFRTAATTARQAVIFRQSLRASPGEGPNGSLAPRVHASHPRVTDFVKTKAGVDASEKKTLGEGLFRKCEACGDAVKKEDFERSLEVCPSCGFHFHLAAERWIELLADEGSWTARDTELRAGDPLNFVDSKAYPARLETAQRTTGVNDAILAGEAEIEGRPVQLGVFVFRFMGGSMGSVVGEVITRMMERGAQKKQPVVLLSCSGGARMQEGSLSLMQMAKTLAARAKVRAAGSAVHQRVAQPRRRVGWRQALRFKATSTLQSPARSSASRAHASSKTPSVRSCLKGFQRCRISARARHDRHDLQAPGHARQHRPHRRVSVRVTRYEEALQWLYGLESRGIKLGLDRIVQAAKVRGNPERGLCYVHVAGSNGEGERRNHD